MRLPRSLQARLGLAIGVMITLVWIGTSSVTAVILQHEMDEVFDSALQETAQRLLPLSVLDIIEREEDGVTQRLGAITSHDEFFTFVVRDPQGRILLQSHSADSAIFLPYDGVGFRQTATHRLYNEDALQGSIRITIAEPLAHRRQVARQTQLALGLPLLVILPVTLLAIALAVRAGLAPLRRFRTRLGARSARDLSPIPADDIPSEIAPITTTLNTLLAGLNAAFEAERSFAANAAHELRTPLAGAIAQAQRLQSESADPAAIMRAADIEATLKRLTRLSERLMQLARAEGGRLTKDHATDLRIVAEIVVQDLAHTTTPGRIRLTLPDAAVMSNLDPDIFGIVCRNFAENALRHGSDTAPIDIALTTTGTLTVANDGPIVPEDMLKAVTQRFARASAQTDGSGLGLAIVASIAARIGATMTLKSPRTNAESGFEATVSLPVSDS